MSREMAIAVAAERAGLRYARVPVCGGDARR